MTTTGSSIFYQSKPVTKISENLDNAWQINIRPDCESETSAAVNISSTAEQADAILRLSHEAFWGSAGTGVLLSQQQLPHCADLIQDTQWTQQHSVIHTNAVTCMQINSRSLCSHTKVEEESFNGESFIRSYFFVHITFNVLNISVRASVSCAELLPYPRNSHCVCGGKKNMLSLHCFLSAWTVQIKVPDQICVSLPILCLYNTLLNSSMLALGKSS